MNCLHEQWTAKKIPLSDGRPSLREFCAACGISNGGNNLGHPLPMIADKDVPVVSYKYQGKTLGQILEIDKQYILWLVVKSKCSDRIKKSAARLYYDQGYTPPRDGEVYPRMRIYDSVMGAQFVKIMKKQNEF